MAKRENLYEIGYLLKPGLNEEAVLEFAEKLKTEIAGKNGIVITEGRAKKETLAYPVKKETLAFFGWLKFSFSNADSSPIKEIKAFLNKQNDILRFLIIKTSKEEQAKPALPRYFLSKTPKEKAALPEEKPEEKTKEKSRPTPEETKIKEEEIDKKIEELLGE